MIVPYLFYPLNHFLFRRSQVTGSFSTIIFIMIVSMMDMRLHPGLHPEKGDGTSCFGVKLDITDLPLSVRKPTQLKEEKTHLDTLLRLQKMNMLRCKDSKRSRWRN